MEREFPFIEVFEIKNTKSILNSQVEFGSGEVPYVTAAEGNNGFAGYISCPDEWIDKGDCVFIGGKTMTVFYQAEDFCSNDSHNLALYPKTDESLSRETYLYLVSAIKKALSEKYTWGNSISSKKIAKESISLPVTPHADPNHDYTPDDIDWAYMERFIAELEQKRIAELDAYLKAAGLDDCELTAEDEAALAEQPVFADFAIAAAFETKPFRNTVQVPTGSLVSKSRLAPGSTPRITVTSANNGISGYYSDIDDKNYRCYENCISASFLGDVFYHPYRASFDMKVHCLKPKNHELNPSEALFLIPLIRRKMLSSNYFNQTSSTDLPKIRISLPVTQHSDPDHSYTPDDIDWAYMERYIRAIEKQVVAGVVEYKDKVIETTKQVIASEKNKQ